MNFYGHFNFDYIQGLMDDLVLGCGSYPVSEIYKEAWCKIVLSLENSSWKNLVPYCLLTWLSLFRTE